LQAKGKLPLSEAEKIPLVRVENLNVVLGGNPILKDIDLALYPGQIHAITGENGAGKSTLAKVIAGIHQPVSGTIFLLGRPTSLKSPKEAIRNGIALIHQEPLIFPDLDVAENVFVGRLPSKAKLANHKEAIRRTNEILRQLGVDIHADSEVGNLSIAQQQMVELATAMSEDAKVWIFDETTASLTSKEVSELFKIIRGLRDRGCAVAMVTHHLNEVFELADTVTVLRDGAKIAERSITDLDHDQLVHLMVGRDISKDHLGRTGQSKVEPFVELNDLSGPGYQNVSLSVGRTEIVGIAGLVGAGRTEVARALFGITKPTSGTISVKGEAVQIGSPKDAQALGFALVPEDRQKHGLFPSLSIEFNTSANILGVSSKLSWLDRKRVQTKSLAVLESFKTVYKNITQPVRQLSGGNQQKTIIARWLLGGPEFLILDEPTRGVDVGARREVHQVLRAQAEAGKAILVISSDLPELLTLTDRIYVMQGGTIVGEMATEDANEESVMNLAFGGNSK
jgi:rhamnose transport system ATP-binding protein